MFSKPNALAALMALAALPGCGVLSGTALPPIREYAGSGSQSLGAAQAFWSFRLDFSTDSFSAIREGAAGSELTVRGMLSLTPKGYVRLTPTSVGSPGTELEFAL